MNLTAPLTDEEIEELRALLPMSEGIKAEAQYREARKLVVSTWRSSVITLAGIVAALLILRDQIKALAHWLVS